MKSESLLLKHFVRPEPRLGWPLPVIATTVIGFALTAPFCEPLARASVRGEGDGNRVAIGVPSIDAERRPVTCDIPIHRTRAVESWIAFHSSEHGRAPFQLWLNRMTRYEGPIRRELGRRGMPQDLVYIALIESGFDPMAVSRARATGLWQFMEGTARDHGLLVNRYVDERLDPFRSTTAAIDLLEALHRRFGSWYLAVAAYNAGPLPVQRALDAHAGHRPWNEAVFWEISPHLPVETRHHIPRLIAAAIMAKDPARFGFRHEPRDPPPFQTVFTPGATPLADVAAAAGVPHEDVRALNAHLLRDVTPPAIYYPVRVPAGTAHLVTAGLYARASGVRGTTLVAQ
ncbi:MAG TPA: lytic transglycosylase domain-containing protein [Longimicrobiales bacterium]|nr:lytic transglycosylase domain-containing protein [Longimicrobiales bacterium]